MSPFSFRRRLLQPFEIFLKNPRSKGAARRSITSQWVWMHLKGSLKPRPIWRHPPLRRPFHVQMPVFLKTTKPHPWLFSQKLFLLSILPATRRPNPATIFFCYNILPKKPIEILHVLSVFFTPFLCRMCYTDVGKTSLSRCKRTRCRLSVFRRVFHRARAHCLRVFPTKRRAQPPPLYPRKIL